VGFAVFGWGYFLMALASPFHGVVRPHLLTSVGIAETYERLYPDVRVEVTDVAPLPGAGVPVGPTSASISGPPQLAAPQFVAVAGGGPSPVMEVKWVTGSSNYYVPSGPNRFYSFECSVHAAFSLVLAAAGYVLGKRRDLAADTPSEGTAQGPPVSPTPR
jgi:hypothetical protein